jgi:hypothetical protein
VNDHQQLQPVFQIKEFSHRFLRLIVRLTIPLDHRLDSSSKEENRPTSDLPAMFQDYKSIACNVLEHRRLKSRFNDFIIDLFLL